jgi:cobalt-zinc-cadmium efflux system protein
MEGAMDHHEHGSGHSHSHAPKSFGMAFALGTALNIAFVAVEAVFGVLSNSTALLADAGHNLSDVIGLLVAWGGGGAVAASPDGPIHLRPGKLLNSRRAVKCHVPAHRRRGDRLGSDPTIFPSRTRRRQDRDDRGGGRIAINGLTAWLFASGRKGDINIRGAFLHMAADAAVSAGVVVAAGLILLTGWQWVDLAVSLVICAVIVWGTWGLLTDSVRMSLAAVPGNIEAASVSAYLKQLPGVVQLHDLHIWPVSTTETALTCHLVMPGGHPGDRFLMETAHALAHRFAIGHATIQIETSDTTVCALASDDVV